MKNVVFLPTARSIRARDASDMPATADLAVIIPTFNEHGNIEALIDVLDAALFGISHELIFVDDWSTDGTPQLITSIARRRPDVRILCRRGRRGLSSAVIEGILSTSAEIVAVIDADLQHDETKLGEMFDAVMSGQADVAIGSRYQPGGGCGDWSAHRVQLSMAATRLARMALPVPVSDPMSGFFVIRRDIVVDLVPHLSQKGFKILLDLLMSAPRPLRIREIPYVFRAREAGVSKLNARVMLACLAMVLMKAVRRWVPVRLTKFLMVGMLGLGVHLSVLRLCLAERLTFMSAQAIAVVVAIGFNFMLNNLVTYRDRRLRGFGAIAGLASFYGICGIGAAANIGFGTLTYAAEGRWWLAGIAGAVAGSMWNFAMSSWFTWRSR